MDRGRVGIASEMLLVRAGLAFRDAVSAAVRDWAVLVEGGAITAAGPAGPMARAHPGVPAIGDPDCVLIPGFVDAHQHGRGKPYHERGVTDQPLEQWSTRFPGMRSVDPRTNVALAATKLLRSAVTSTLHHHVHTGWSDYWTEVEATAEAYRTAGIRATIALDCHDTQGGRYDAGPEVASDIRPLMRTPPLAELVQFVEDQNDRAGSSTKDSATDIRFVMGLRGVNWCSDDLLEQTAAAAAALGVGVHLHVAETQRQRASSLAVHARSPVERLARAGLLDVPCSLAHCVWVSQYDIATLAGSAAVVVHNPASNLRLASGVAPVASLRAAGVPVAIGADNMFLDERAAYLGDLRLCRALHSASGAAIGASDVLEMAWEGGAAASFRAGAVGRLQAGALADLALFRAPILVRRAEDRLPWEEPELMELLLRVGADDLEAILVGGRVIAADELSARLRLLEARAEREAGVTDEQRLGLMRRRKKVDEQLVGLAAWYEQFEHEPNDPFYRYNER